MTIRQGDAYVVETFEQFTDRLGVDVSELLESLSAEDKAALRSSEATPLSKLPDDEVVELLHTEFGTGELILSVLESRAGEYTHLYDGTVHRIIDLHPQPQ